MKMTPYEASETIIAAVPAPYESKDVNVRIALELRKQITKELNYDIIPARNEEFSCGICGSRSHLFHPATGKCFVCNMGDMNINS